MELYNLGVLSKAMNFIIQQILSKGTGELLPASSSVLEASATSILMEGA